MQRNYVLGGGLEPAFRVLVSAIFHEFRSGISIRVENYGIERKQNCSFFVVKLLTKFSSVLTICCLPRGSEESQCNALLSAHHSMRRNPARALWGLKINAWRAAYSHSPRDCWHRFIAGTFGALSCDPD